MVNKKDVITLAMLAIGGIIAAIAFTTNDCGGAIIAIIAVGAAAGVIFILNSETEI